MTGSSVPLSSTPRTRLRRMKDKGRTDRDALFDVLRAGLVCHRGVLVDGSPMVVPTVYGFDADHLYLHGSVASRSLTAGTEVCATVPGSNGGLTARLHCGHSLAA